MKYSWVMGFIFALSSCLGTQAPVAPSAAIVRYPVTKYDDPSGLRVVLEEAPNFGTAAAVLSVSAGSSQEPAAKVGLAHLAEHLVFRGSHDGTSLWDRISELGGIETNGITGWDDTRYIAMVPAASAEKFVALIAEVLRDPLRDVDQGTFEQELRIVQNELHLRSENGAPVQALNWLFPEVFPPEHPYSHPLGGTLKSLGTLTLVDVRDFVAKWYRPEHATLVLSAPTTAAKETAWVASAFAQSVRTQHEKAAFNEITEGLASPKSSSVQRHEAPVATPVLWLGWRVPTEHTTEGELIRLIPEVLQAAYYLQLDHFDRNVSRLEVGSMSGKQAAVLYLKVPLKNAENPESTAKAFIGQLRSASMNVIYNAMVFDNLKRRTALNDTYAEENILSRTSRMTESVSVAADPIFVRARDARLVSIHDGAIADYIKSYLTDERAHMVFVTPEKGSQQAAPSSASDQHQGSIGPNTLRGPRVDLTMAAEWASVVDPNRLVRRTLGNGLQVWVWPQPQSLFHTALVGFHGGRELGNKAGMGTAVLWARQYRKSPPSSRGLLSQFSIDSEDTQFSIRGIGTNLDASLEEVRGGIDFSVYWPPQQFTSQIELFKREEEQPGVQLRNTHLETVFGGHVYGRHPSVAQIREIAPNDIYWWLEQVRRPENGVLIFVGDTNPEEIFRLAEARFGDFGSEKTSGAAVVKPPPSPELRVNPRPQVLFRHQPGLTQAFAVFSCSVPQVDGDSYAAARLFERLVQEQLWSSLRKRSQVSYSVTPNLAVYRGGTAMLSIAADIDYGGLESAMASFKKVSAIDAPSLVDENRLGVAKVALVHQSNWLNSSTPEIAQQLLFAWNHGWSVDSVLNTARRGLGINAETITTLEKACRQSVVIGFLGDEPRLRAAWGRP